MSAAKPTKPTHPTHPAHHLNPLRSTDPLIVYIDFKSPYAYLSIEPTLALADELGIAIDWRPFVLDIPSYLGSAKLDGKGKVAASNRTAEQWSGVKYAYFDCRRYANLSGLTIRGTQKIWDTQLPAIGLLWVRALADPELTVRFIRAVLEPFWKRELDVEALGVIVDLLTAVGAPTAGFVEFARGAGKAQNDELQKAAFAAGVFGVPSYVIDEEIYFGREHVPLIRARLRKHLDKTGASPSARSFAGIDAAYELPPAARPASQPVAVDTKETPQALRTLAVAIDFASPQCVLALAPTLAFAREFNLQLRWLPASGGALKRPGKAVAREDRGQAHRRLRAESRVRYLAQYAEQNLAEPLTALFIEADTQLVNAGLLWANRCTAQSSTAAATRTKQNRVDRYVQAAFQHIWFAGGGIAEVADIEALLGSVGITGFAEFWAQDASRALEENQATLAQDGFVSAPTYFFAGEPYAGREHLPLLRALCSPTAPIDASA